MSDKDDAAGPRDEKGRFQAGHAGPGRPKGSRNKLGEAFLESLFADFAEHGPATIVAAREADPVAYVKVVASLLPRELKVNDDVRELTDDELAARIRQLNSLLRAEGFDLGEDAIPAGTTH